MANANTKHAVKQRVLEARRAENAARAAREAAIVEGLSEVLAQVDRAQAVQARLHEGVAAERARAAERVARLESESRDRIARLTEAAREESARCERAAGEAVMRLREQGETVAAIATQTGQSQNRVRDMAKLASQPPAGAGDAVDRTVAAGDAGNAQQGFERPDEAGTGAGPVSGFVDGGYGHAGTGDGWGDDASAAVSA